MKAGDAVLLALAAAVREPVVDVTYVFYDAEEVEARATASAGSWRTTRTGSQATSRCWASRPPARSRAAATARCGSRSWCRARPPTRRARGSGSTPCTARQRCSGDWWPTPPREVDVDGLVYREGLNAVGISGGIAGNVIPDECVVTVNYRFAPARSQDEALAHVREVFAGYEVRVTDTAPGARPGLDSPAAAGLRPSSPGSPACRRGPSRAGPTSHGSPRSGCRP